MTSTTYLCSRCPICDSSFVVERDAAGLDIKGYCDSCDYEEDYSDDGSDCGGCECELDWRCGMHAGQYTPLELMNHDYASEQTAIDAYYGM